MVMPGDWLTVDPLLASSNRDTRTLDRHHQCISLLLRHLGSFISSASLFMFIWINLTPGRVHTQYIAYHG